MDDGRIFPSNNYIFNAVALADETLTVNNMKRKLVTELAEND